ncbi:MAG TPA: dihydrodipicolinate synthase family protein [Oscillospiraceae bacterium]|nr:dihydrodipicolinate synthase family protein [Oscillospiraceae bacterium]HPF55091.1 dihydrodipicolinate synthase family protein [Clostridiales bacterium]HPK34421.1 dihydrodipicolinate synthase family protein [Oscillospiraceae bacterium]HPR75594.1 dihydrodipicolinate synthase family protein [Oscillospiraceae bacterium]
MSRENPKILVPIFTPFKSDYTVDYDGLKKLVRSVLDKGADGLYTTGSSAEFVLLTEEERKKTLEVAMKAADGAHIIAHIGSPGVDNAIMFAKHAASLGADAVASVPPFYYPYQAGEVKSYYTDIADACGLKIMVYSLSTQGTMSLEQYCDLLSDDRVYALKYTQTDYYVLNRIKQATKKPIFSGKDEAFAYALPAGADGAIGTSMNFQVEKFIKVQKLFEQNDIKAAMAEQIRLNNVVQATVEARTLPGMKYAAKVLGILDNDTCRRPLRTLTEAEKARIEKAIKDNM